MTGLIKTSPVLVLILFTSSMQAQYREEFGEHELRNVQQSDSTYRVNRVKVRRSLDPISNKLLVEMMFDKEGRITQMQYEPYLNGQTRTTYFFYQADGKLASMKDVLIKGKPNANVIELIGKKKYDSAIKAVPGRAEYNYTLRYTNDSLTSLVCYRENGAKVRESLFSRGGLVHELHYFSGSPYQSTTTYINNLNYPFLPVKVVLKNEGLNPNESRFEYLFDKNGLLVERIEHKKIFSPFHMHFNHDKNGLLVSAGEDWLDVKFEYKYWK